MFALKELAVGDVISKKHVVLSLCRTFDQYPLVLGKQLADPGTVDEAGALRLCTLSFPTETHTR